MRIYIKNGSTFPQNKEENSSSTADFRLGNINTFSSLKELLKIQHGRTTRERLRLYNIPRRQ